MSAEETNVNETPAPVATEAEEPAQSFEDAWEEDETHTVKTDPENEPEEIHHQENGETAKPTDSGALDDSEPSTQAENAVAVPTTDNVQEAAKEELEPSTPAENTVSVPEGTSGAVPSTFSVDTFLSSLEGDMKQFAEDYPEEAKATATIAQKIVEQIIDSRLKAQTPSMNDDAVRNIVNSELSRQRQEFQAQNDFQQEVLAEVPDANEILQGKENKDFMQWLSKQPRMIQEKAKGRCESSEAIYILKSYKNDRGIAQQKQTVKNTVYRGVGTGKVSTPHAQTAEEAFDEAFNSEDEE